jgi:hypothetical protein
MQADGATNDDGLVRVTETTAHHCFRNANRRSRTVLVRLMPG